MHPPHTTASLDTAARVADPAPLPTPTDARAVRTDSGLSQHEISTAIGVHERTYRRFEAGGGANAFACSAANDRACRLFAHLAATVNAER